MKYLYLVFELLISLASFQSSLASNFIIISYPDLEQDFVDFRIELKNRKTKDDSATDPFTDEVKDDLQKLCKEISRLKMFEMLDPHETESRLRDVYSFTEDITNLQTVKYENMKVKIDDYEDSVPLYPCFKETNYGFLYLSTGFNKDFKFLFKQDNLKANPVLYGLVEPTPSIDNSFYDKRHLEKYFVQTHRMYEPSPRKQNRLVTLNGHQHFRLCSLIATARWNKEQRESVEYSDIETMHALGYEGKYEVTFEKLDKLNAVYATLEVYVTALPCFTNEGQLTFLVSENPKDSSSVFVLQKRTNPESRKIEIFVIQHIRNIALLRNSDKFY